MLRELLYALDCDDCGARFGEGQKSFALRDDAVRAGWLLNRRKDGQYGRAGKDRCPACLPSSWGFDVPGFAPDVKSAHRIFGTVGRSPSHGWQERAACTCGEEFFAHTEAAALRRLRLHIEVQLGSSTSAPNPSDGLS